MLFSCIHSLFRARTPPTRSALNAGFERARSLCPRRTAQTTVNQSISFYPTVQRGLEISVGVGYNIGVGNKNAKNLPVEVGIGKQITPNFYIGGATCAWIGTTEESKPVIPFMAGSKLLFPLSAFQ